MTFKVIAEAKAKRDWNEAVDWYDERAPGVGLRLNDALRKFLQTRSRRPERFPLATRLTHKVKVPKPWPYSVYFTIDKELRVVRILAIWHGRRDSAKLLKRLK